VIKASGKMGWYAQRLRAMSVGEMARRVVERWHRWREPAQLRSIARAAWDGEFTDFPKLPWQEAVPPELRRQLAVDAEKLARGEWVLFGWKKVEVGAPPCWHRDATLGVVIDPDTAGKRLDHRHLAHGADARAIWEINRWAEMTRMAMHSALNGDVHAIRVAQLWLEDWCDRNAPGEGINWTSALEAGLRLMNFCWFDALVRGCNDPELAHRQDELTARIVPPHAWWVWRRRSFGSSANNHLIGEVAALVMAARRWPALQATIGTPAQLWKPLEGELLRQFHVDGGNREQALHYHLFAWEMIWHAGRAADGLHGEALERLRDAAQFFVNVAEAPEGWDYGDSDDAQVLPLALKRKSAVAELRGWLLGKPEGTALRYWLGEPPKGVKPPTRSLWHAHPESGMAVWRDARWTVRADASPLGFSSMAAHGHLDALHVSLWIEQQPLVIDPGTGAYYSDAALRGELAAWEAHNGPVPVAGRATPQRMGPFLWAKHHAVPELSLSDGTCAMRLECEGQEVRRGVCAAHGQVEICDDVGGSTPHVVTWQLAPGWQVQQEGSGAFLCVHEEGLRVHATLSGAAVEKCELVERKASPCFREVLHTQAIRVAFQGRLTTVWRHGE